ncbi:MAG TPA: LPS export ABC transporter ATP-binding protein [Candidatus Kapabacteria bacterium]|nr:LPS export ABC transporter ATP-binding protein [Candidatus Kapabacteria bacterium]
MSDILRTKDLVKRYGKRTVVRGVSIEVKQGEVVGLLGPNGAGKTTTFYMIVGMIRPESGLVYLNDDEITRTPMYKRARRGIGYLPQEASVFRHLSVEDNLLAVLELLPMTAAERKQRAQGLMEELNVTHICKSKGYMLSGGERRRVEIARALAMNPKFILLDEPFAGIDPLAVEEIMNIIGRLKAKNIGILITDHNVHETLSITDRSYILIDGAIFRSGNAETLANDEEVRRYYLGSKFSLERYAGEK